MKKLSSRLSIAYRLSIVCILSTALNSTWIWAEEGKVVDLGEMSVQGELRKPAITWIDSQKTVRDLLPSIWKSEYEAFETELLSPSIPTSPQPPAEEKEKLSPITPPAKEKPRV